MILVLPKLTARRHGAANTSPWTCNTRTAQGTPRQVFPTSPKTRLPGFRTNSLHDIAVSSRCHLRCGQSGTMTTASALSSLIFRTMWSIRLKGGFSHKRVPCQFLAKASWASALPSPHQRGKRWLASLAKPSTRGVRPSHCTIFATYEFTT